MKKTIVALAICHAMIHSACTNHSTQTTEPENFPVTTLITLDTATNVDYVAEIHALQNVEIRARVTGYLEKFHIDEGQYVSENQLLFTINNREYVQELAKVKALYKSAVADVNAAELELKNVALLMEKKIVSTTELELAKNKLESQKAKMEQAMAEQAHAQLRLSNTEIRAPFNGIINRIPYKIGSLIEEGTLLTSISQDDEIYAYFDVSEKEYLAYARNMQKDSTGSKAVSLILADGFEHPFKGKVETVEGVIDANTGNIAFRARFKNTGKIIKHGSSGKVRLRKTYNDVIVIPQKSTFEIQDKLYVYVVDKNNKTDMRTIETSYRLPHLFIISKGLAAGDKIIYEGIQNIRPGMVIKPTKMEMGSIIKKLAAK